MRPSRHGAHGFTLVEVMVALVVMAVLAGLAWRGIDGMMRARDTTQDALDRTDRLVTVMAQWDQDLRMVFDEGSVPTLRFDGRSLRLVRRADGALRLVVWTLQDGRWTRWASAPATRQGELQDAWMRSQLPAPDAAGPVMLLDGVDEWQLYYFRGGQRSNAQSTGDLVVAPGAAASAPVREALPDGIELVLRLQGRVLTRLVALESGS